MVQIYKQNEKKHSIHHLQKTKIAAKAFTTLTAIIHSLTK